MVTIFFSYSLQIEYTCQEIRARSYFLLRRLQNVFGLVWRPRAGRPCRAAAGGRTGARRNVDTIKCNFPLSPAEARAAESQVTTPFALIF